jgi:hypothetical protein
MVSILHRLPYSDSEQPVFIGSESLLLHPFRILTWVTICPKGDVPYDIRAPLIPAVLDTGFNGFFTINEEQIQRWIGPYPAWCARVRSGDNARGRLDVRSANLWLHRNVPDTTTPSRTKPQRLEIDEGLMVFRRPVPAPVRDPRPAFPILGLRALDRNGLCFVVDGRKRMAKLIRPWWCFASIAI